jgi:hypothetical protein
VIDLFLHRGVATAQNEQSQQPGQGFPRHGRRLLLPAGRGLEPKTRESESLASEDGEFADEDHLSGGIDHNARKIEKKLKFLLLTEHRPVQFLSRLLRARTKMIDVFRRKE